MNESNKKTFSGNICCFGVSHMGVPSSVVLAEMCPSLNVFVVDLNPDSIISWNTKQIPIQEPGLEEMLKKCHNRNLIFTTNTIDAVKMADIIFISLNSPIKSHLNQEENTSQKTVNLKEFEKAIRLIAEVSESNKIIVLKSTVSLGSNAVLKRILLANKMNNLSFQVLSVPEFFSTGNAVSNLLRPDRILIGSDLTTEGLYASEALASIYSQWVPRNKILTINSWSAELAKIAHNAFLAQRVSNLSALCIICEETDGDISDVANILGKCSYIGSNYLEPSFGFGGTHLINDIMYLKCMCENLNLFEAAEYWNQVLIMNEFQKKRFFNKILFSFFNNLNQKRIGIWGVTFKKNVKTSKGSVAVELCLKLIKEGATVALYDPKMDKRQLMDELKAAGLINCPNEISLCANEVILCDDPYKAAFKADAIIVGMDLEEIKDLNYQLIYKQMIKPAFIFDGWKCLPHKELIQIGFNVETIGKKLNSKISVYNK